MTAHAFIAADLIRQQAPDFSPQIGIILGSGLHTFTHELTNTLDIPYQSLPNFPAVTVAGHVGQLTLGYLKKLPIVCLQGRTHTYEGTSFDIVKTYVRTLKLLGCRYLIVTNASGSLHADMQPGELMLITDHMNFQGGNPLVGPNDEDFGPRFPPLDDVYDKPLREHFVKTAGLLKLKLHQGVYACMTGPSYETAAEISALKTLGADAVGMSTVPEVIVANHCGMKVGAIATLTNFATGLASFSHSHTQVLSVAKQATSQLIQLLTHSLCSFPIKTPPA